MNTTWFWAHWNTWRWYKKMWKPSGNWDWTLMLQMWILYHCTASYQRRYHVLFFGKMPAHRFRNDLDLQNGDTAFSEDWREIYKILLNIFATHLFACFSRKYLPRPFCKEPPTILLWGGWVRLALSAHPSKRGIKKKQQAKMLCKFLTKKVLARVLV